MEINNFQSSLIFSGKMNIIANSHQILIDYILDRLKIEVHKDASFLSRIKKLERATKNHDYAQELIADLKTFNRYWNFTKHGQPICNHPSIYIKGREQFEFTEEIMKQIEKRFAKAQGVLLRINERVHSP